ncbi:calcium/sodium antiporter [Xanthocytophaga agilis]|uniref:Calcium/sodium antiporter n=1 Tax=Xanthocytophaga agilis TaxID=3048010 RepID=A0AAE3RDS6_9BACT|nr:calcium/sodium antiporter [Xanthocytophaga agilis]MDJ1506122.1 calcium/sodium antiporter [Xanthocytophaga agilis]
MIALWIGVFIVSLLVLILAARFFTQSAEVVGHALGMSPFAVGVIIVAVGTSLPELISSLIAVSKGSSEIVAGNILGSSASNLLFVMSLTSMFSKKSIRLGDQYIFIDLHYLVGSAAMLTFIMWDGLITPVESLLLLSGYIIYTIYLLKEGDTEKDITLDPVVKEAQSQNKLKAKDLLIIAVSVVFIFLGANYTITALEVIAEALSISKAVVSVTVLSLGTTLPEAVVSITASRQGKADIAVGNILGSCIFNAMAIPGITGLIDGIKVPAELLSFPLPIYLTGAVLFYLITQDKRISRWEGALFLLFYILFIGKVAHLL